MKIEEFILTIFGITSNLSQLKLIPALYDLEEKNLLPAKMKIIGVARSPLSESEYKLYLQKVLTTYNKNHNHPYKNEVINRLLKKMHYLDGHLDDPVFYPKLKKKINLLKTKNVIYYLATYPDIYHHIFENLQQNKMNKELNGWVRLMIEKPIGSDFKSAKDLNILMLNYFKENQIYRLDHYLGKETLQNILTFRFGNGIFEPLLNKEFIDHVQITASENYGIGERGGYYDSVGALKDVGQNHQLQMLAFALMDAPEEFSNQAITNSRLKLLQSLKPEPNKIVYGQYEGYKSEKNVNIQSNTDTFYALKCKLNNDKYQDIPVYIRAGKQLKQTATEISIIFKTPKNRLFKNHKSYDLPNVLIFRIQPNEGIVLKILTKKPGNSMEMESDYMQFCYKSKTDSHYFPDPYEKLLLDTIVGDQTFFNDAEEVEAQWKFIDPYIERKNKISVYSYKKGTWGPKEADDLIAADGREWLEPSMDFCRI